jgi:hypothetical protein
MCDPISAAIGSTLLPAATAGTAVAGTAAAAGSASFMSSMASAGSSLLIQGITAGAQSGAEAEKINNHNRAVQENAQSAKDAYFIKSKQTNLRLLQEQNQASQQKQDDAIKTLKAQGTAIAAAGGSGVQGVNIDQLMNDFERSEGIRASRVDERLAGLKAQTEMDKLGFQSEAQNRINSMQPIGVAESAFNILEPIAGVAVNYFDTKARFASVDL